MRIAFWTVIIEIFALLSAAGQQSAEGTFPDTCEGVLRDIAGLEAKLVLGVATTDGVRGTLCALIERGDGVLNEWAPPGDELDAIAAAGQAVNQASESAVEAILEAKARIAKAISPHGIHIDPWAGVGQECGYFPATLGPVALRNGGLLPDVDQGDLPRLVPPLYRLAEALGLGHNRVLCEPRFIDPIQVERPSHNEGGGVNVIARLHCELIGHFVHGITDGEAEGHHDEVDADAAPDEETFRVVVISQSRRSAGINRMNGRFENRKEYGVRDYSAASGIRQVDSWNPWMNEVLPAAAAQRGWVVTPSRDDSDARESQLGSAVRDKLQAMMEEIARELRQDEIVRIRIEVLDMTLNNYQSAIQATMVKHRDADDFTVAANFDLQAIDLASLVESGELDGVVLRRIVRATALALDATRRTMQVKQAPVAKQAKAAAMAEALNSLARWTLR
ncbi:MAG: hypothetical protein R3F19_11885 [Verrucomicrobiales bacterium]